MHVKLSIVVVGGVRDELVQCNDGETVAKQSYCYNEKKRKNKLKICHFNH